MSLGEMKAILCYLMMDLSPLSKIISWNFNDHPVKAKIAFFFLHSYFKI